MIINVSVIIPAHNAAKTIAKTLVSLTTQSFPEWEAIIVDDGSTDGTVEIARRFAQHDSRFRLVSQPQMGGCAARNAGINLARFDWLLFLDADDWLLPRHLERMTETLLADPTLDAVHCGWARVALSGEVIDAELYYQGGDLFDVLARRPLFPPLACVLRRSIVEAVGGWDTTFQTCQEWDLWQRVARTGARFGIVREVLGHYRMRPGSVSTNAPEQLLRDGLRVINLGHAIDPRVANPHPSHKRGLPPAGLSAEKLVAVCWPAGLALALGEDALSLLNMVSSESCSELDPFAVADSFLRAVPFGLGQTFAAWVDLWPVLEQRLDEFLLALEAQSMAPGLAHRVRIILERLIMENVKAKRPLAIGTTYAVCLEITELIPDIVPPPAVARLYCDVEMEGEKLGTIELPVCDQPVPGYVINDAIAAAYSWSILGRFFEHTLYPQLRIEHEETGLSLWRDVLCLARDLAEAELLWSQLHDQVGWTVFLQEIWARPGWSSSEFYDPQKTEETAGQCYVADNWFVVEVSDELPDVKTTEEVLNVILTIGGTTLGIVPISVEDNTLSSQQLRVALTIASGFELCRAAVREGLLGKPLSQQVSLRARLANAACRATAGPMLPPSTPVKLLTGDGRQEPIAEVDLAPYAPRVLARLLLPESGGLVLTRRSQEIGTSASRRAILPASVASELIQMAITTHEPVIRISESDEQPKRVVYAPDLIWRPTWQLQESAVNGNDDEAIDPTEKGDYEWTYFESLFARQADPWKYSNSPYEQTKYEQSLELLPNIRFAHTLELACAEGHFTMQLAPRVDNLLATDISEIALERAAERCARLENVDFARLDLVKDAIPGRFQLIVCSEVLYFVGGLTQLQAVARKLADALEPGGYLVMAHANLVVDDPTQPGYDWDLPFGARVIGATFAQTESLRLVKELRTPMYRVQLFQRPRYPWLPLPYRAPRIMNMSQPTSLPPRVASTALWQGGTPRRESIGSIVTDRLPILMYHRVVPTYVPGMARYCLAPEAFEAQLRYLRDSGFYSVTLEAWQAAVEAKRPLPGRAILITFDDGYRDFQTYAWPLLQQYGFSATVFLVAEEIGGTNRWDRFYGEGVPLLDWQEIHELHTQGVAFGSHSASHPPLTGLSHSEIVREAARSRAKLERYLGEPIRAFAYPYGDVDQVVQHLIGACGYVYGLTCRPDRSRFNDSLLDLPRIEVRGSDNLEHFITKLTL